MKLWFLWFSIEINKSVNVVKRWLNYCLGIDNVNKLEYYFFFLNKTKCFKYVRTIDVYFVIIIIVFKYF